MRITNWGRYPVVDVPVHTLRGDASAQALPHPVPYIPRGMGRCYGDSALGDAIIACAKQNRFLHFAEDSGILTCEAGVTFADVLTHFVPRGWFPPVTPGTKFVSLGGAVASDVHGKNHHKEGCISDHLLDFRLLTAQGDALMCSRTENAPVFWATVGGMGLTGIILSLRIRLKRVQSAYIAQRALKAATLAELLALFTAHADSTYSVAWIDTLQTGKSTGRSILLLGEHCDAAEGGNPFPAIGQGALTVPFDLPSFALNRLTIGTFNWLFYHKQLGTDSARTLHYEPYFYPLDKIHHWNRIYGKRGFTQYQFVVPFAGGHEAIQSVLAACNRAGFGSFLSVLKTFGAANRGLLSFPMEGLTLTLDFPIKPLLFPLLDRLDAIVEAHGGQVYLTKDVRLPQAAFERMYAHADAFRAIRQQLDPEKRIQSLQSRRLGI